MRRAGLSVGVGLLLQVAAHGSEVEGTHTLDLSNRTMRQQIRAEIDRPAQQKFVEIEVASVVNPKRIRVTFDVDFQPDDGKRVPLGGFALFPPDNPGRFIVATSGKLGSKGCIVLSMVVLDETGPNDVLSVTVKRISFREK
jgi:hypothetical protein